MPRRSLQEFLTHLGWAAHELRDQVRRIFATEHLSHGTSVRLVDETTFAKQGGLRLPASSELKYFLTDAADGLGDTPTECLLWVALTRQRVERLFQDDKTELGLDHFKGRKYVGLMRPLMLTLASHLFLMRATLTRRGKNLEWALLQVHRILAPQICAKWIEEPITNGLLKQLCAEVE